MATTEEVQKSIKDIGEGMIDLLKYKNEKYGNSALEPLGIFTKHLKDADVGENVSTILVRLDDKLQRVKNSDKLRINDIADINGYTTLLMVALGVTKEELAAYKD
jgi:hypothetical protein